MAVLMGVHLALLIGRQYTCTSYEKFLVERLNKVPVGSLRAREIRQEIQEFLEGDYVDCSRTATEYATAADKYLAVILSLLTGAGVSAAAVKRAEVVEAARDVEDDRDLLE